MAVLRASLIALSIIMIPFEALSKFAPEIGSPNLSLL